MMGEVFFLFFGINCFVHLLNSRHISLNIRSKDKTHHQTYDSLLPYERTVPSFQATVWSSIALSYPCTWLLEHIKFCKAEYLRVIFYVLFKPVIILQCAVKASAVNNMFCVNCDWMIKRHIKGQSRSPTGIGNFFKNLRNIIV